MPVILNNRQARCLSYYGSTANEGNGSQPEIRAYVPVGSLPAHNVAQVLHERGVMHTAGRPRVSLTAAQEAAILDMYLRQLVPIVATARRLGVSLKYAVQFLRGRGLMRSAGNAHTPKKLFPPARQQLEAELPTTTDIVLARKYGVTRGLVWRIRKDLGIRSSRVIRHQQTAPVREKRDEQARLALELRARQRAADRLALIERRSVRWLAGVPVVKMAREFAVKPQSLAVWIVIMRARYPEKFPYRHSARFPLHSRAMRPITVGIATPPAPAGQ